MMVLLDSRSLMGASKAHAWGKRLQADGAMGVGTRHCFPPSPGIAAGGRQGQCMARVSPRVGPQTVQRSGHELEFAAAIGQTAQRPR